MKSICWPIPSRTAPLLGGALALALVVGCTKDTESKAPRGSSSDTTHATEPTPVAMDTAAGPVQAMAARSMNAEALGAGGKPAAIDTSYSVKVEAPQDLAPGAEGVARVHVLPGDGWKMNREYPTRLQVVPPAGVTVIKDKQSIDDAEKFEDKGATFAVKFKAGEAGQKSFKADFKFAVCTEVTCDPKREEVAWDVDVK